MPNAVEIDAMVAIVGAGTTKTAALAAMATTPATTRNRNRSLRPRMTHWEWPAIQNLPLKESTNLGLLNVITTTKGRKSLYRPIAMEAPPLLEDRTNVSTNRKVRT